MIRFLLIFLFISFVSAPGFAQDANTFSYGADGVDPVSGETLKYVPPMEPTIPPVQFLNREGIPSLQERVDRLIQGIKVDIPPEYDHYGYELRRYMAHVAGPDVLGNPERLKAELKNVQKAKIIFKYWQQEFLKETSILEKELETKNASPTVRSSFKYNQGVVNAFMTECKAWLDNNEAMLQFLISKEGLYTYKDPNFQFDEPADRYAFAKHYQDAQQARKYINDYMPFGMMIY